MTLERRLDEKPDATERASEVCSGWEEIGHALVEVHPTACHTGGHWIPVSHPKIQIPPI